MQSISMTLTLAQEITLFERLQAQIVCFLFRQLDNRLKTRKHNRSGGKGATYVYAQPWESHEQQWWTFVHLLRERCETRCAACRTKVPRVSQADLTGTRFNGDNDSFIGTQVHVEGLQTSYSISA